MSDELDELVRNVRSLGAAAVASAFLEAERHYEAYVWFLVAAAQGHADAEDMVEGLETAEAVCDEDQMLAHLQVAVWLTRGIHVDTDATHALASLERAAFPFLKLPSDEEIRAAPDVEAAIDAAWTKALSDFGFPAPGAPADLETARSLVDEVLRQIGWPDSVDFSIPLGPAMPNRPWWIHTRHVLA
jgi:hypothetical protein